MCPCYCCGDCTKWLLEWLTKTSITSIPDSNFGVSLLYDDQNFYETKEIDENDKIPNVPSYGVIIDVPGNGSPTDKTELIRRKREQEFRMATMMKAQCLKTENPEMVYFAHQRKQLLNGHGYNLAIFKGHVRGKSFIRFINQDKQQSN